MMPNPAQIGSGPDKRVAIGLLVAIGACILYTSIRDPLEPQNRFDDKPMQRSLVDPEFASAHEKARSTIEQFIETMRQPMPNQDSFSIKTGVKYGERPEEIEYLWLHDLSYKDGVFAGVVSNIPELATSIAFGDTMIAAKADVVDWSYTQDGKTAGAFTIRVMRERLSPEQQSEFDQEIQFFDP